MKSHGKHGLFLLLLPFILHGATDFQSAFGGASINATALDGGGNIYVAGSTPQGNIPVTPGAYQQTFVSSICGYSPGSHGAPGPPIPCTHGFVAKVDPSGKQILWATYLGGELWDFITAISVDENGNVYVTGGTTSTKFPVTANAWFPTIGTEAFNGFISKLTDGGSRLAFSTYLPGGTGDAIAVDGSQNVFVAGTASGEKFPVTPNAYQSQRFPGNTDAFVLKLNPSGSAPVYSTLIGGTFADVANALQVDGRGNAFVAGFTASIPAYQDLAGGNLAPFPSTPGALYLPSSGADVFIVEVNPTGSGLVYSTVFGGSGNDSIASIALDSSGAVLFTGETFSTDWPLPGETPRSRFGGGIAGRISPDGSRLIYSTYLTGAGAAIVFDARGNALLVGSTRQLDLATTANAAMPCSTGGVTGEWPYVMELTPSGGPVYASYLAAPPYAAAEGGHVYTQSRTAIFDVVNIFVSPTPGIRCVVSAANYLGNSISPGEIVSIFGPGIGPSQASGAILDSAGNVTSKVEGARVLIGGLAAPLLYVSSNQINAVVPFGIAGQTTTTVSIEANGTVALPAFSQAVSASAPAIFTLDGSGYGQAAALNQDGSINSASNPAAQGSIISFFVTGVGMMTPVPADGSVSRGPSAVPVLPVTMYIGFTPVEQFQYVGDAPGFIEGAVQINAVIPKLYQTGGQTVSLRAGDAGAGQTVSIFVK